MGTNRILILKNIYLQNANLVFLRKKEGENSNDTEQKSAYMA